MKFGSKRLVLAAAGAAVVSLIGVGSTGRAVAQQAKEPTAGEFFKNVTTTPLKGLTVADFMGSMGVMTSSLAFDCSDCHTGAGTDRVVWEADTARKRTARRMVEMVAAINKNYFAGSETVSCWTCHHGREHPSQTTALDALYSTPPEEYDDVLAPGEGQPSANEIFDKYITALGGAQKLAGLTSYIATGTQQGFARVSGGGKFEIFAKAPDQRAVIISFPNAPDRGTQTRAYDGKAGWVNVPRSVLGEYQVTGTELDGLRVDALLSFPGSIKTTFRNLKVGYPDTVDGKQVNIVQGTGPNGLLTTMYFDKTSGLLVRLLRFSRSPIGRVPTQVDYADYRDVNGIKFPFTYSFLWLDGRDRFQLTDVKVNVPIDAAKFGKPSGATKH
jgi:hypothetical protein